MNTRRNLIAIPKFKLQCLECQTGFPHKTYEMSCVMRTYFQLTKTHSLIYKLQLGFINNCIYLEIIKISNCTHTIIEVGK